MFSLFFIDIKIKMPETKPSSKCFLNVLLVICHICRGRQEKSSTLSVSIKGKLLIFISFTVDFVTDQISISTSLQSWFFFIVTVIRNAFHHCIKLSAKIIYLDSVALSRIGKQFAVSQSWIRECHCSTLKQLSKPSLWLLNYSSTKDKLALHIIYEMVYQNVSTMLCFQWYNSTC